MPQMAPMYWLLLLLMFILCFFMIMTINYFLFSKFSIKYKSFNSNKTSNYFNWKW